jgi:TetR/AcrR family transcriptional regulator, cholesterol catabolism regulator
VRVILKSEGRRGGRQDEILCAAARLFSTRGFHATSVQDIADAVGILKGSLYHHFESKEAILYRIVKQPIAHLVKTVGDIAAGPGTASEKIERAATAHVQAFHDHYPHLFVYLKETEDVRQRFQASAGLGPREYERLWGEIVQSGIKSGELRADLDATVVVYGLLGMLNWLYKWYDPNGRMGPREIAAQFSSLALSGLTAARGGRPAQPVEPQDVAGVGARRPRRPPQRSAR